MVRATLGVLKVRTKSCPAGYVAWLTPNVPQGALSSHVDFNAYIIDIAKEVGRKVPYGGAGSRAVTVMLDDVLLQAMLTLMRQEP